MQIIAWIIMTLVVIQILLTPLMFGKDRGVYDYKYWLSIFFEACLLIPLCLRVLNII